MKFGNASWGLRETPLEEQLKITHNMGLSVLELGIANAPMDVPLSVTHEEILKIKEMFKKYDVELLCAATGNDFTVGTGDVEKVKRVIDICEDLGIKYLRIFAGFSAIDDVDEDRFKEMLESISEVYSYCKNVILTVETHGGVNSFSDGVEHFMSVSTNAEKLLEIPDVLFNYDPANLYAVGEDPIEFYEKIKDRVGVVHLKDFVKVEGGHMVPSYCGAGTIDWSTIMKKLARTKCPMLFEYENTEDVEDGLRKSYDYIRRIVK